MAKKTKRSDKNGKRFKRLLSFALFSVTFVLGVSLILGGIFLSAYWENIRARFSHESWVYTVGLVEDDDYRTGSISDEYLYVDGVLYLNMTDIALMCDMTVVGDFNALTYFSVENNDQTVTFYFNSDKITVNGEHFKMNGVMFEREEQVYVPASFVSRFCSGIIVEIDEDKRTLSLYRHSLGIEYDPLDEPYHIYEDVTFMPGGTSALEQPDRGLMFSSQNAGDSQAGN